MSFLSRLTSFRQLCFSIQLLLIVLSLVFIIGLGDPSSECEKVQCFKGSCVNGSCACDQGWQGVNCDECGGRRRLTEPHGFITNGPRNYNSNARCMWIIKAADEKPHEKTTITLKLEEFATECGWDHLYIRDGDSIHSPLLAVYSGIVAHNNSENPKPELYATSGKAFVYFASDRAYNMRGFNISYRINSCSENCSGICEDDGSCSCDALKPTVSKCPTHSNVGQCLSEENFCNCPSGFKGLNCTEPERNGYWMSIIWKNRKRGFTSHQALAYNGFMWIFGGDSFYFNAYLIWRYRFSTSTWELINTHARNKPLARYGHAIVEYQDKAYMYGGQIAHGKVVNEMWIYNFTDSTWWPISTNKECLTETCAPLAVVGHTANMAFEKMFVIFGHSPVYGYLDIVQEYDFVSNSWQILETTGAIIKGGYGHTSLFDAESKMIFVYGGYRSYSRSSYVLSDELYAFEPLGKFWSLFMPSQSPRFLHSASIIDRLMFVFGGNARNVSSESGHNSCYSSDLLVYDLFCDYWYKLPSPSTPHSDVARFGHSSVVYNGSMYIFGGFNGRIVNNILVYTPGSCEHFTSNKTCKNGLPGIRCFWMDDKCSVLKTVTRETATKTNCSSERRSSGASAQLCKSLKSCSTCTQPSFNCVWCENVCSNKSCKRNIEPIKKVEECDYDLTNRCRRLHNCHSCQMLENCTWDEDLGCDHDFFPVNSEHQVIHATCPKSCSQKESCANCTEGCLWCEREKRCIDSNSYEVSFLYGSCLEWSSSPNSCPATKCSEYHTCETCQINPLCGWCQRGSKEQGHCLQYDQNKNERGPPGDFIDNRTRCPDSLWFYTGCPKYASNDDQDDLPKTHFNNLQNVFGSVECKDGFYPDPILGTQCLPCNCGQHSHCDKDGICYCKTIGINHFNCEKCAENIRIGNIQTQDVCFHKMKTGISFTGNLSESSDRIYEQMNFKNTLNVEDGDVEFSLLASQSLFFNISVGSEFHLVKYIITNYECSNFKKTFTKSDISFCGTENITFYVYVYHFKPPLSIQVAFTQTILNTGTESSSPYIILLSSCFVILLVVGIILWKVKLKYNTWWCRRCKVDDLATRPFASFSAENLDDLVFTKNINLK